MLYVDVSLFFFNPLFLVYFANGELLRLLAFKVLEVEFYLAHVFIYISRRNDDFVALDKATLEVNPVEIDRQTSLEGNEVKALFPVWIQ